MRPLYRVVVTRQAQADIRGAFQYIHKRAPLNAERWLWRLYSQLDTLEQFPERCAYARERLHLDERQVAAPLSSHYAARSCSARLIHLAISVAVAPIVSNDRIIRSSDTDRSAASILATRDWLDPNRSASVACVKPLRSRSSRTPLARASLSSRNRLSSYVS